MTNRVHAIFTEQGRFWGHVVAWPKGDGTFDLTIQDTGPENTTRHIREEIEAVENQYGRRARVVLND